MAQKHCRKFQSAEYRVHERYRRQTDRQTDRRQTDGRTTTYSEHEHEFTFANKTKVLDWEANPPKSSFPEIFVVVRLLLHCSVFLVTAWLSYTVDHGPRIAETSAPPCRTDGTGWQSPSDLTSSELRRLWTRAASVAHGRQSSLSRSRLWAPRSDTVADGPHWQRSIPNGRERQNSDERSQTTAGSDHACLVRPWQLTFTRILASGNLACCQESQRGALTVSEKRFSQTECMRHW